MIGIIIGTGVFVGSLISINKTHKEMREKGESLPNGWNSVSRIVVAFLLGLLVFLAIDLVMMLPAQAIMLETKTNSERIASTKIIALEDTSSTKGRFFLGCGSVGEEEWYVYYADTKYGYKKNKISANDIYRPVYIKYIGEGETPRIDEYAEVHRVVVEEKSIFLSIFSYIAFAKYEIGDELDVTYSKNCGTENADAVRYEIYIPEGSIKEDYEIDIE